MININGLISLKLLISEENEDVFSINLIPLTRESMSRYLQTFTKGTL